MAKKNNKNPKAEDAKMEQAKECILDIEAIYKIDCYDIS